MDRVAPAWFAQGGLMGLAAKFVPPVLKAVWPWEKCGAADRGAHLIFGVAVEDVPVADAITAQPGSDLGHGCYLVAVPNPMLLA